MNMTEEKTEIKETHVMPMDDIIEHIDSEDCLCEPYLDGVNEWNLIEGTSNRIIWVHRHIRSELQ